MCDQENSTDDADDEEDTYTVFFLTPSPQAYDMADKVRQANEALLCETTSSNSRLKSKKVTFRDGKIASYAEDCSTEAVSDDITSISDEEELCWGRSEAALESDSTSLTLACGTKIVDEAEHHMLERWYPFVKDVPEIQLTDEQIPERPSSDPRRSRPKSASKTGYMIRSTSPDEVSDFDDDSEDVATILSDDVGDENFPVEPLPMDSLEDIVGKSYDVIPDVSAVEDVYHEKPDVSEASSEVLDEVAKADEESFDTTSSLSTNSTPQCRSEDFAEVTEVNGTTPEALGTVTEVSKEESVDTVTGTARTQSSQLVRYPSKSLTNSPDFPSNKLSSRTDRVPSCHSLDIEKSQPASKPQRKPLTRSLDAVDPRQDNLKRTTVTSSEYPTRDLSRVFQKRSCCEDARRPRLPTYNGLRSEYGLSAEQLQERKRISEARKNAVQSQHQRHKAEQDARRRLSESMYKEWLRRKSVRDLESCCYQNYSFRSRIPCSRLSSAIERHRPNGPRPSGTDSSTSNGAASSVSSLVSTGGRSPELRRLRGTNRPPKKPSWNQVSVTDPRTVAIEDLVRGAPPRLLTACRIYLGLTVR